jgi:hypothetical protein
MEGSVFVNIGLAILVFSMVCIVGLAIVIGNRRVSHRAISVSSVCIASLWLLGFVIFLLGYLYT